jgi:hypothetical protein
MFNSLPNGVDANLRRTGRRSGSELSNCKPVVEVEGLPSVGVGGAGVK